MKQRLPGMGLAIVILLIFIIASTVNAWLLVERGPAPLRVFAAVGFIVATVGWLFVIARIRRA